MIDRTTSLRDVAGAVAAALRTVLPDPIVVGGSAATVHAAEAYRSRDADFVIPGGARDARSSQLVLEAMATIGFRLQGSIFVHDKSEFTVDFVPGPVQIGNDVVNDFDIVETTFGPLRVLRSRRSRRRFRGGVRCNHRWKCCKNSNNYSNAASFEHRRAHLNRP